MGFNSLYRDVLDGLKARYGDRLLSVVLFGSKFQGRAKAHSDLDILVLLSEAEDEDRYARAALEEVMVRYLTLSPLKQGDSRFFSPSGFIIPSPGLCQTSPCYGDQPHSPLCWNPPHPSRSGALFQLSDIQTTSEQTRSRETVLKTYLNLTPFIPPLK